MNTVSERPRFGRLLREFRLAAGLSQESLAELARMSADGISALERGANRSPQRETLALLVDALHLDSQQRREIEAAAVRPSRPRRSAERPEKANNLPRMLTPLYGRETEIEHVKTLVRTSPLVTLTGTGGVGKTRLAIEVAGQLLPEFRDGICFIDLAPIADPEVVTSEAAALLGTSDFQALHDKNVLCVFDNCEHVTEKAAELAETLIRECPHIRVLATSRQPLNITGEQLFRVASLERDAAVTLFADIGKRASESFAITSANRPAIERIVERLDGIALAIELAAARLKLLGPEQIEARLSERFRILTGGSPMQLRRHQTMRETIDWSYDLLEPEERQLFRRLGVFAGSFSLEAAGFVGADKNVDEWKVLEVLSSLVDKSLVIAEPAGSAQRYRLLESMRAYAREKADGELRNERMHGRHAEYYTALAERASKDLCTVRSTGAWALSLDPDMDNFRAALDWTLNACEDPLLGVRLLTSLQEYWVTHGAAMEALRYAQRALAVATNLPQELHAALWLTIARMHHEYHMSAQEMLDSAERASELYAPLGDSRNFATALRERGTALLRFSRIDEAETDLTRALSIYRSIGDLRMAARTLGSLGYLRQFQGRFGEARDIMIETRQLSAEIGDDRGVSMSNINLAEIDFALGDVDGAIELAQRSLAEDAMLRKSTEIRVTQESNLSAYLFAAGRPDEARAMALRAVQNADSGYAAVPIQHLAAIVAASHPKRAARLIGHVDKVLSASAFARERTEQYTYDSLMRTLEEKLSADEISRLQKEGAAMTREQAVALAQARHTRIASADWTV